MPKRSAGMCVPRREHARTPFGHATPPTAREPVIHYGRARVPPSQHACVKQDRKAKVSEAQ